MSTALRSYADGRDLICNPAPNLCGVTIAFVREITRTLLSPPLGANAAHSQQQSGSFLDLGFPKHLALQQLGLRLKAESRSHTGSGTRSSAIIGIGVFRMHFG